MKTTITPGQIIKTRSLCDYDCIYTIEILSRSENGFAMVKLEDQEKPVRRKIYTRDDGREYIMAFGRYSMAPAFYAPEPAAESFALNFKTPEFEITISAATEIGAQLILQAVLQGDRRDVIGRIDLNGRVFDGDRYFQNGGTK